MFLKNSKSILSGIGLRNALKIDTRWALEIAVKILIRVSVTG
jgi:hypothetical protein